MNLTRTVLTVYFNLPFSIALVFSGAALAHQQPFLSSPMSGFLACLIERGDTQARLDSRAMSFEFKASDGGGAAYFYTGETIQLGLTASVDGYYYCYYQQSDGSIIRLAPSAYTPDNFISRNTTHTVPGGHQLRIKANRPNSAGKLMCVLSKSDQKPRLETSGIGDIETLPLATLCQVYCLHQAFATSNVDCVSADVRIGILPDSSVTGVIDETASSPRNRCSC